MKTKSILSTIGLVSSAFLFLAPYSLSGKKPLKNASPEQTSSNRWVVDKIVARVNGVNILKSDLEQPRIEKEGGTNSLQELILEELLIQRASEKHLLPTSADIERQIVTFKMQNNITQMSETEFEEQLKESGFTVTMYKNQLGRLLASENVRRAEVSEKIVVTSQEVEDYFKKHPEYTKETYHLKIATLSENEAKRSKKLLAAGKITNWKDLGKIEKEDIDPRYAEVFSMKNGETSTPVKSHEKYLIIHLIDKQPKRLQTLDERYGSIEKMFHQKKRVELLKSFQEDLMSKASIVYL